MAVDLYPMCTVRVGQWVRLPDGRVGQLVDDDEAYYVALGDKDDTFIEVNPATWVEKSWQRMEEALDVD